MSQTFEIDAYRRGSELLAILRGQLVLSCCQDAKTRLGNLFTSQVELFYLSLSELAFLDSAGLGVLVGLKMNANRNKTRLVLLSPPSRILDIFRISKLDTIFEIREGAEAEVILKSVAQPEYCLWRDSRDARQEQFNTVADFTPRPAVQQTIGQITVMRDSGSEHAAHVRQLCDDAVEAIRQGNYPRAIECYRRALALEPDNLSALNNMAIVSEKRPEWYSQAAQTWQRVLQVSSRLGDDKHAERARKHLETLAKLTGG